MLFSRFINRVWQEAGQILVTIHQALVLSLILSLVQQHPTESVGLALVFVWPGFPLALIIKLAWDSIPEHLKKYIPRGLWV